MQSFKVFNSSDSTENTGSKSFVLQQKFEKLLQDHAENPPKLKLSSNNFQETSPFFTTLQLQKVKKEKRKCKTPADQRTSQSDKQYKIEKNTCYYGTGKLPCPDLGPGWQFEQIVRQHGKSAGQYDVYYHSPDHVRLRSKLTLQNYVGSKVSLANFDYNLGRFVDKNEVVSKKDALLLDQLKFIPINSESNKSGKLGSFNVNGNKKRKVVTACLRPALFKPKNAKCRGKQTGRFSRRKVCGLEAFRADVHKTSKHLKRKYPIEDVVQKAWELLDPWKKNWYLNNTFYVKKLNGVSCPVQVEPRKKTSKTISTSYKKPPTIVKRFSRCKICVACLTPECGKCSNCRDKPKFGGKGTKRQSCIHRKCIALSRINSEKASSTSAACAYSDLPEPELSTIEENLVETDLGASQIAVKVEDLSDADCSDDSVTGGADIAEEYFTKALRDYADSDAAKNTKPAKLTEEDESSPNNEISETSAVETLQTHLTIGSDADLKCDFTDVADTDAIPMVDHAESDRQVSEDGAKQLNSDNLLEYDEEQLTSSQDLIKSTEIEDVTRIQNNAAPSDFSLERKLLSGTSPCEPTPETVQFLEDVNSYAPKVHISLPVKFQCVPEIVESAEAVAKQATCSLVESLENNQNTIHSPNDILNRNISVEQKAQHTVKSASSVVKLKNGLKEQSRKEKLLQDEPKKKTLDNAVLQPGSQPGDESLTMNVSSPKSQTIQRSTNEITKKVNPNATEKLESDGVVNVEKDAGIQQGMFKQTTQGDHSAEDRKSQDATDASKDCKVVAEEEQPKGLFENLNNMLTKFVENSPTSKESPTKRILQPFKISIRTKSSFSKLLSSPSASNKSGATVSPISLNTAKTTVTSSNTTNTAISSNTAKTGTSPSPANTATSSYTTNTSVVASIANQLHCPIIVATTTDKAITTANSVNSSTCAIAPSNISSASVVSEAAIPSASNSSALITPFFPPFGYSQIVSTASSGSSSGSDFTKTTSSVTSRVTIIEKAKTPIIIRPLTHRVFPLPVLPSTSLPSVLPQTAIQENVKLNSSTPRSLDIGVKAPTATVASLSNPLPQTAIQENGKRNSSSQRVPDDIVKDSTTTVTSLFNVLPRTAIPENVKSNLSTQKSLDDIVKAPATTFCFAVPKVPPKYVLSKSAALQKNCDRAKSKTISLSQPKDQTTSKVSSTSKVVALNNGDLKSSSILNVKKSDNLKQNPSKTHDSIHPPTSAAAYTPPLSTNSVDAVLQSTLSGSGISRQSLQLAFDPTKKSISEKCTNAIDSRPRLQSHLPFVNLQQTSVRVLTQTVENTPVSQPSTCNYPMEFQKIIVLDEQSKLRSNLPSFQECNGKIIVSSPVCSAELKNTFSSPAISTSIAPRILQSKSSLTNTTTNNGTTFLGTKKAVKSICKPITKKITTKRFNILGKESKPPFTCSDLKPFVNPTKAPSVSDVSKPFLDFEMLSTKNSSADSFSVLTPKLIDHKRISCEELVALPRKIVKKSTSGRRGSFDYAANNFLRNVSHHAEHGNRDNIQQAFHHSSRKPSSFASASDSSPVGAIRKAKKRSMKPNSPVSTLHRPAARQ